MLLPALGQILMLPQSLATILVASLLIVAVILCSICLCCSPRSTLSWKLTQFASTKSTPSWNLIPLVFLALNVSPIHHCLKESNGSLFDRLHGGPGPQKALQWPRRYRIALGAARELSYMHHDCSPPILHGDVKSSNILLDGDLGAKIADFGVSRKFDRLGNEYTVSGYVRSHGYIAPENADGLNVNEKSDIYSFGVVMLELVSGRKATGEAEYGEGEGIVDWMRNTFLRGGEEMEVLDERILEDNFIEQMKHVLHVGLVCTRRVPNSRPSMRRVVEMLEMNNPNEEESEVLEMLKMSLHSP